MHFQDEENKVKNRIVELGLQYFNDSEKRQKMLKDARKAAYSPKKLCKLEAFLTNWSQDVVDYEVIKAFWELEEYNEKEYIENYIVTKDRKNKYNEKNIL